MVRQFFFQRPNAVAASHLFTFIKFGTVGAITAAIYFLLMWIFFSGFEMGYIGAISIAYLVSTAFHFLANRYFTFGASEDRYGYQLIRYLVMWVLNYLLTITVVSVCFEQFELSPYIGVCVAVVLTMFVGYVLSHYWVFKLRR